MGAALIGAFFLTRSPTLQKLGGYVTMFSACTAFYVAFAMMLSSTTGRVLLPLGQYRKESNIPGGHHAYPIQFAAGEPGVKQGQ